MNLAAFNPFQLLRAKALALEWSRDPDEIERIVADDIPTILTVLRRGAPAPQPPVWLTDAD